MLHVSYVFLGTVKCTSGFYLTKRIFQVILMLTADLDGQNEKDKACVERLLGIFVKELEMDKPDTSNICQRSNKREVHLLIMRLLSEILVGPVSNFTSLLLLLLLLSLLTLPSLLTGVLMTRLKHTGKSQAESSTFISQMAAATLSKAGVIDYCLTLLKALLEYWKT